MLIIKRLNDELVQAWKTPGVSSQVPREVCTWGCARTDWRCLLPLPVPACLLWERLSSLLTCELMYSLVTAFKKPSTWHYSIKLHLGLVHTWWFVSQRFSGAHQSEAPAWNSIAKRVDTACKWSMLVSAKPPLARGFHKDNQWNTHWLAGSLHNTSIHFKYCVVLKMWVS